MTYPEPFLGRFASTKSLILLARPEGFEPPAPRFVGGSFTLIALHFLANRPFIAPLNLNGLRCFCKPERWHRRLG